MKVLIADDHGLYRAGLSYLLKDQLQARDVIEVGTLDEALDLMAHDPDIDLALFDLYMPGMAGPDSLRAVKATYPQVAIAVISADEDREKVLSAIACGLSGYIPKNLPDEEIAKALQMMLGGYIFVPPFMTSSVSGSMPQQHPKAPPPSATTLPDVKERLDGLTARQRDVLSYVVKGRSNKEIARELDIAEGTVKIHLAALFSHFGAHNRTELAMRAQGTINGSAQASRRES